MINNEINAIKDRICMTIMPKRTVIMIFMWLFLMMPGTKSNCPRKHTNPSEECGNVRWILLWAMNRLSMKGRREIPLKRL